MRENVLTYKEATWLLTRNKQAPLHNYEEITETGCWLWKGGWRWDGYGLIAPDPNNKITAHRVFYAYYNKVDIAGQQHVLHKCDVRSCCNPKHLFLGNNRINGADMVSKGRSLKGIKNGRALLTNEQVVAIYKSTKSLRNICAEFDVAKGTVYNIKHKLQWRHITDAIS